MNFGSREVFQLGAVQSRMRGLWLNTRVLNPARLMWQLRGEVLIKRCGQLLQPGPHVRL